ncbi:hypothetical protein [Streptomyces sp. B21-108]|uniref:AraC-like ligand-binding domain-containing protein n=1 Tax=Streptomyces sp. B21-108 TaxID=3039419 RepID=UPI003FA7E3C2
MSLEFSTATVDDPSQLSYWRQVVVVTAQGIADMQVATVDADPHTVFRSPSLIRRSPQDDFLVNLAVRGSVVVTQDGRDAVLRSGEFALYDSARPCRITGLDRFGLVSLKIPRALFTSHCRLPHGVTATCRARRSRRRRPVLALPPLADRAVIARRVGVTRPYLFRLFPDKKAIFITALTPRMEDTRPGFRAGGRWDGGQRASPPGHDKRLRAADLDAPRNASDADAGIPHRGGRRGAG